MKQNRRKKRVLFVDDDADWRHVPETSWLENSLDCEVVLALDGVSAMEKVDNATVPFDLIILDALMPDPEASPNEILRESGLRFLRKLKGRSQKIPPVIAYSALSHHAFKSVRKQFEQEGVTWLPKGNIKHFKQTVKDSLG